MDGINEWIDEWIDASCSFGKLTVRLQIIIFTGNLFFAFHSCIRSVSSKTFTVVLWFTVLSSPTPSISRSLCLSFSPLVCHLLLTVILLHFLLLFICLCFLLHLLADSLSLSLLSNSIYERCTLHHSVSLYISLPFIFSTPFSSTAGWRNKKRERKRVGEGGGRRRGRDGQIRWQW